MAIPCLPFLAFWGCGEDLPKKIRAAETPSPVVALRPKPLSECSVLVVHSYHPEYPWVASITRGVREVLEPKGVRFDVFHMDTKRRTEEAWKTRAGELAEERRAVLRPDVVITVDDNAQQYFGMKHVGQTLPIVFCGVNADPSKYGYPACNVTGVIERPHFIATIEFARTLFPVKRVAVISSDDPTSAGALSFIKQSVLDVEVVELKLMRDFDRWKETIEGYAGQVDAFAVYMYHTLQQDGDAASLDPQLVMSWTARNAKVPSLGFFEFGVEDGLLIGVVESGEEHGRRAAEYAVEILRGRPVGSLPVIRATIGKRMINRATAERLRIALPDGVEESAEVVPKR